MVHGHIVTTVYAHLVVLGEYVVVEVFLPVSVVVVEVVVDVVGVLIEVRHGHRAADELRVGHSTYHFGEVVAVLAGIHHLHLLGCRFEATVSADVDAGYHALAAASVDKEHTVGTLGTVEGRSVLHHFHAFDIVGIDDVEHVVHEALVERGTVVLHIHHDTVDNDEGLGVGIQRVQAINEHGSTLGGHTAAVDGAHRTAEFFFDFFFNRKGIGLVEPRRLVVVHGSAVEVEILLHALVQVHILVGSTLEGELGRVVVLNIDEKNVYKLGDIDGVLTVVLGQGTIETIVQSLHFHTCKGLLGSGIIDVTRNLFHFILGCNCFLGYRLRRFGVVGFHFSPVLRGLCRKDTSTGEHEKADTCSKRSLHQVNFLSIIH